MQVFLNLIRTKILLSGFQCTDPYLINLPISIIEKVNSHNSIRHYCKLPLMQTLGQSQLVLLNNRGLSVSITLLQGYINQSMMG